MSAVAQLHGEEPLNSTASAESRFLALFWELADYNDIVRLSAAHSIASAVEQCEANKNNPHRDAVFGYTVNRLVQGLCSSNKKARQGFATALTLLVARRRDIGVLLVEKVWKIIDRKDQSKQEVKDELIGRLFLVLVLCQSGVVGGLKVDQLVEIVNAILEIIGRDKNWLMHLSFEALSEVLCSINDKDTFTQILAYLNEKNVFEKVTLACDVLSLAFSAYSRSCHFNLESEFQNLFESSSEYESSISKQLLRSSDLDSNGIVHSLWAKILKWFFETKRSEHFNVFWNTIVVANLFTHSPSVKRKSLGLALAKMALELLTQESDLGVILCPSVCDMLVSFASSKQALLHNNSLRFLESIVAKVTKMPSLALVAINRLSSACRGTNSSFDKKTRTSTIKNLLACVDVNGLNQLVNNLFTTFSESSSNEKDQIAVIDQLYSVMSNQIVRSDMEKKKKILIFLMGVAYLHEAASISIASPKVAEFASERFLSAVSSALSGSKDNSNLDILKRINEWFDENISELEFFSQDLKDSRALARKNLKKISKHKYLSDDQKFALNSLIEHVLLMQMWSVDESMEGTDILRELSDRISGLKSSALEEFTTGIVDVVLSVLIKPHSFLREMAKTVFRAFINSVNQVVINDLSTILITKKNENEEEEELEENENDESAGEEDEEEEEEESESEGESDDQSDNQNENECEFEEDDEDDETEADIKLAPNDIDDIDMADYTSKLEAVFRERFNAKRLQKEMAKQAVNFKLRVLDLFEIIVKKRDSDVIIIGTVMPLLEALKIHSTSDRDVEIFNKCMSVFRLFKSISYPKEIEKKSVEDVIQEVSSLVLKCKDRQSLEWYAAAYSYLFRIIRGNFVESGSDAILSYYQTLLQNFFFEKNSNLNISFFNGLITRHPEDGWKIFGFLVKASKSAVSGFACFQAYLLLETVLRHNSAAFKSEILDQFNRHGNELICNATSYFSISESEQINSNRAKAILKVVSQLVQTCKKVSIDAPALNDLVSKLQAFLLIEKFKNLKNPVSNVLHLIGGSKSEDKKRKIEEDTKSKSKKNKKQKK